MKVQNYNIYPQMGAIDERTFRVFSSREFVKYAKEKIRDAKYHIRGVEIFSLHCKHNYPYQLSEIEKECCDSICTAKESEVQLYNKLIRFCGLKNYWNGKNITGNK